MNTPTIKQPAVDQIAGPVADSARNAQIIHRLRVLALEFSREELLDKLTHFMRSATEANDGDGIWLSAEFIQIFTEHGDYLREVPCDCAPVSEGGAE